MPYYIAEIRLNKMSKDVKSERKMKKRLTTRFVTLLLACLLVLTPILIVPAAMGSDPAEVIEALEDLGEDISELPEGAEGFKNSRAAEGQRKALINKINATIKQVKAGAYRGALNKLENDLKGTISRWVADEHVPSLIEKIEDIIDLLRDIFLPPVLAHDVAVIGVSAPDEVTQGDVVNLSVEVANPGDSDETFNVTVTYNTTLIGIQTVSLASKGSTTIPFTWDTTDVDSGTYTITAEAILAKDEDPNNNKASTTITVKLELILLPPVAKITENATTALTGEVIRFDASESYDPDGGDIVEYFWSFGDGTTASGVTVDHSYADDGTYIVTLTITDDEGSTASATATKIIGNRLPVALFAQSVLTVKTGRPTTFNASDSYDLDGTIVSYEWGFGDGIVVTETDPITSHVYDDDGVYTVTLTVTDDDGATNSTSITKTILNRLPTASFTQNATTINVGEAIRFDASHSFDPDGDIVEYFWDFGDGTNDTGMTVDHVYTEGGNYTVTLTVTDDDGSTATESSEIVVKALAVPWALYAAVALGIIAAAATVIYLWYRRRKRKKAATTASTKPSTKPTVTLYLPANILAEPDKSSQSG